MSNPGKATFSFESGHQMSRSTSRTMNALISIDNSNPAQHREGFYRLSYNYNHYNLPLSHIMVIVIMSDEDMLPGQNRAMGQYYGT